MHLYDCPLLRLRHFRLFVHAEKNKNSVPSYFTPSAHYTITVPMGRFVFWWEWVDSNHLRLKPTDLQSAPALQLRRTPNLFPSACAMRISLGAGSGNRTRISSLEGLHTSLCTMPATNSKPCDYILNLPKRKYFSQGQILFLADSVYNIFHFQQKSHIIPTGL